MIPTSACQTYTHETLIHLPEGYDFRWIHFTDWAEQNSFYFLAHCFGDGNKPTNLPVDHSGKWVVVKGIHGTHDERTMALYSGRNAGNWCEMDDVCPMPCGAPYAFLKSDDMPELDSLESKDEVLCENGVARDYLRIPKDIGLNPSRLRLHDEPVKQDDNSSKSLPAVFQNPTQILNLVPNTEAVGFNVAPSFYRGDCSSNDISHNCDIASVRSPDTLILALTNDSVKKKREQRTTPRCAIFDSDVQEGILQPIDASRDSRQLVRSLKHSYNVLKVVFASTEGVFRLDYACNKRKYDWFFGERQRYGAGCDFMDTICHTNWTGKKAPQVQTRAVHETADFRKKATIVDTVHNRNYASYGRHLRLLKNIDQSQYENLSTAQLDTFLGCLNDLDIVRQRNVIIDFHSDPGVGWEPLAANVVTNTT